MRLHSILDPAIAPGNASAADDQGSELSEVRIALFTFSAEVLMTLARFRSRASDGSVIAPSQVAADLGVNPRPDPSWLEELWPSLKTKLELNQAMTFIARLHFDEQTAPTSMSHLPLWNWIQQLADLGASTGSAEFHGWIPKGSLKPNHVFLVRAAKLVGFDKGRLIALVDNGAVEPSRRLIGDRRQMLFRLDDLARISRDREPRFPQDRSLSLGLTSEGMRHLKSSGVVALVRDWRGAQWLNRLDLEALLAQLAKVAQPLGGDVKHLVNLASDAVWRRRHIFALKEYFSQLSRGTIPLWFANSEAGFSRYYVSLLSLEVLVRRRGVAMPRLAEDLHQLGLGFSGGSQPYDCSGIAYSKRPLSKKPKRTPLIHGQLPLPGFH